MHILTRIALFNRWITFTLVAVLVGVSIFATLRLKQEMIPNIEVPMTTVATVYPGATPDEVMNEVTIPVEGTFSGIRGLDTITSTSIDNMSFVFAEFDYGTNMNEVNATLGRRLAEINFPPGVPEEIPQSGDKNPNLVPLNMSMLPVVIYSLSADLEVNELRNIALERVVPELRGIDGVFSVSLEGGEERVLVTPDAGEMNLQGIAMAQLVEVLSGNHYESLDDIESVPLTYGTVVGDVAEVDIGPAPGTAITRTNGQNSVGIVVMKYPEANTVTTANAVVDKVNEIGATLTSEYPESGMDLVNVFDQSDYIERSISELGQEAIIGGVLAVIVIFLFLLTLRGALVIALSIPLSILIGFLLMSAWGLTINILTLGAMGIAVGRIVDDSIVVLEVIYRRIRQGESFRSAALNGSREVAMPVASATLATVAIFLPLAFVGGIVGEMFVPFALTVTFALLASLVVSLTVVPALSNVLIPKKVRAETENAWYQRLYTPALKWGLRHRAYTLLAALFLFIGSMALVPVVGTSFMPSMGEKTMVVEIEMPLDTDLSTTSNVAREVETVIRDSNNPNYELYYTTVGTSGSFVGGLSSLSGGGGSNSASVEILLNTDADLDAEVEALTESLGSITSEGTITVRPMASGMGAFDPSAFRVYVMGSDYNAVVEAANDLTAELDTIEGLENVEADVAQTLSKPNIEIDPAKVAFHVSQGLDPLLFQKELSDMMTGTDVAGAGVDNRGLFVTAITQTADTSEELGALIMQDGLSYRLRLVNVADARIIEEPTNIRRIDQQRAATVSAEVTEKDVGAVNRQAQEKIDALAETNPGVTTKMGGVAEEMAETFGSMGIAIIVAMVIAFVIVVISFRSFITPVLIMVSLPLASIGALVGLLIAGYPIGASSMMGMLMLVGIVLTNAIVLLALVEQLRAQGKDTHDALVQAGRTRIRPILMTALTTMIALVPLAVGIGEGGVLLASELAIVVLGGLFSSTLLTLIVIPVLYSVTARFRRRPPAKQASGGLAGL